MKDKAMTLPSEFYSAWARLRKWGRLLVARLAGHGVFDFKHFRMLTNPNLPIWLAVILIGLDLSMTVLRTWRVTKATPQANGLGLRLLEVQSS